MGDLVIIILKLAYDTVVIIVSVLLLLRLVKEIKWKK